MLVQHKVRGVSLKFSTVQVATLNAEAFVEQVNAIAMLKAAIPCANVLLM